MKAKLLKTDGDVKEIQPQNGADFALDELQQHVGGYIEIVRISKDMIMVVNEEGLLEQLEPNLFASAIVGYMIVGNVVVCDSKMVK